jgi:hypothetical protein
MCRRDIPEDCHRREHLRTYITIILRPTVAAQIALDFLCLQIKYENYTHL